VANIESIPHNKNLTINVSVSQNQAYVSNLKFSPTDPAGNVLDLTGYNDADLTFTKGIPSNPDATGTQAMTIVAADDTGITLGLTSTQAGALYGNMVKTKEEFSIFVGDGTDTVLAGIGSLALALKG